MRDGGLPKLPCAMELTDGEASRSCSAVSTKEPFLKRLAGTNCLRTPTAACRSRAKVPAAVTAIPFACGLVSRLGDDERSRGDSTPFLLDRARSGASPSTRAACCGPRGVHAFEVDSPRPPPLPTPRRWKTFALAAADVSLTRHGLSSWAALRDVTDSVTPLAPSSLVPLRRRSIAARGNGPAPCLTCGLKLRPDGLGVLPLLFARSAQPAREVAEGIVAREEPLLRTPLPLAREAPLPTPNPFGPTVGRCISGTTPGAEGDWLRLRPSKAADIS